VPLRWPFQGFLLALVAGCFAFGFEYQHRHIPPAANTAFVNMSSTDHLMVSLTPTLLATLLSVPVQDLCNSFNSMLPFRALASRNGAAAEYSLLLSRSGGIVSQLGGSCAGSTTLYP